MRGSRGRRQAAAAPVGTKKQKRKYVEVETVRSYQLMFHQDHEETRKVLLGDERGVEGRQDYPMFYGRRVNRLDE